MSIDLVRSNGDHWKCNNLAWARLLVLAETYGWNPRGTDAPPSDRQASSDWTGAYVSSDGQEVNWADGQALANALERAVKDIPAGPIRCGSADVLPTPQSDAKLARSGPVRMPKSLEHGANLWATCALQIAAVSAPQASIEDVSRLATTIRVDPASIVRWVLPPSTSVLELFTGQQTFVRDFISFCRRGPFTIQ